VQRGSEWITSNKYKKETGRWSGAPQTLRLHPDSGNATDTMTDHCK